MATTLGQVSATIALNTVKWRRGAKQAADSNRKLERSMARMGRSIDRHTRGFRRAAGVFKGFALAGTAAAGVLGIVSRRAIQATDEMSKMSRRIDVSVELLQGLQFAADSYNISQTQLIRGFVKFRSELAAIRSGTYSEAETYIRDLDAGLLSLVLAAGSAEDAFRVLLNQLNGADTDKALSVLNLLFSKRAGASILQVIGESPNGIDSYISRVRELNGLTGEQARLVEDVNQSITDLSTAFSNSIKRAVVSNREAIIDMLDRLTDFVVDTAPGMVEGFTKMADLAIVIADKFKEIAQYILPAILAFKGFKVGGLVGGVPGAVTGAATGIGAGLLANNAIRSAIGRSAGGGGSAAASTPIPVVIRDIKIAAYRGFDGPAPPSDASLFGVDAAAQIAGVDKSLAQSLTDLNQNLRRQIEDARGLNPNERATRDIKDLLAAIRKPFEKLQDTLTTSGGSPAQLNRLADVIGDLDLSKHKQLVSIIEEQREELKGVQEEQARIEALSDSIADSFSRGVRLLIETGSIARGLRSILAGIIAQIVETALIAPIAKGFGSFLSDLLPAAIGGGGGKALGGSVLSGRIYSVGEQGKELFQPYESGRIVPNSEVRNSAGRGGGITINVYNQGGEKTVDHASTNVDLERGIIDVVLKDLSDRGDLFSYLQNNFDTGRRGI